MKKVLCLAVLATSAVWANEAADRAAIEATVATLNTSPTRPDLFTADFPNTAELQRLRDQAGPTLGGTIQTPAGTLVISREPMGEAAWYPGLYPSLTTAVRRFVTRSVTFVALDTAVVVSDYHRRTVLFVMKNVGTNWRIASFRVVPEARVPPEARAR